MTAKNLFSLAGFLLASFSAGAIGSQFMPGDWFTALNKPSWNPPGWLFGPVWTLLYLLMGVAAWRVWRKAGFRGAPVALGVFACQLVLNAAWSWLFFGLHLQHLGCTAGTPRHRHVCTLGRQQAASVLRQLQAACASPLSTWCQALREFYG